MTEKYSKTTHHNSAEPIRGDEGAPIIGPTNPAREAESRDRLAPPSTDNDTLPNLKWSFADCHRNRLPGTGGHLGTQTRKGPAVARYFNALPVGGWGFG